MAKKKASKRLHGRLGRPPKDLVGDVETRILDAAQHMFLEKGYHSASIDEIAELAPASKPTIYSYFPGKEALFTAVVARVINGLTGFEGYIPGGRTVQDKLTSLGTELVERFIKDTVGVTRVTIAEADRFPELSRHLHEASRDRAANAVSATVERRHPRPFAYVKAPVQHANEAWPRLRSSWISSCSRCLCDP